MVYSVLPDSPVIHLLRFPQRKNTKNLVPETYHSFTVRGSQCFTNIVPGKMLALHMLAQVISPDPKTPDDDDLCCIFHVWSV